MFTILREKNFFVKIMERKQLMWLPLLKIFMVTYRTTKKMHDQQQQKS